MPYVTQNIKELIKAMEGYSEQSYVDATGRSIGYGHFIQPGEQLEGRSLSKDEAEKLLEQDIAKHQEPWIGKLKADIGEEGIAALTSFAYNVGPNAVAGVVSLVNEGKTEEAIEKMSKYNKSREGGVLQVNKALVERREFEGRLLRGEGSGKLSDRWANRKIESLTSPLVSAYKKASKLASGMFDEMSDVASIVWNKGETIVTGLAQIFTKEHSYDPTALNLQTNKIVLQELRELNVTLGFDSNSDAQEANWVQRILQEGRGWQDQS